VNVGLAWGTGGGVGVHAVKVRVRRKVTSIHDGIDSPFCDGILGARIGMSTTADVT
jgi:hypothetical protein